MDDFEEVIDDDRQEPIEDDDEYVEEEGEKQAQYEILDENATMIFERHQDAVFTARVSPNGAFIASGGQDDRGFVYTTQGELVMALFGHKESVVSVCWNKDSTLLASADLSGLIKVWDIEKKKCTIEFEEEEIEFVRFHPLHKSYLLAAQSDGNCYFYSCGDGNFKILPGAAGVKCVEAQFLGERGQELLVLYEDSSLRIFSIKNASVISTLSIQRQIGESICMDLSGDSSRLLVGSASGQLCCVSIDSQYQMKVVQVLETDEEKAAGIKSSDEDEETHPIEVVKFWSGGSSLGELFVACSLNGFVYVFESTGKLRLKLLHPDGVNGLIFAPGDVPRFISACFDARLRIWDCRNGEPLLELGGHKDHILDISREGMHVVTASDDGTVRYWDLNELSENKA